MSYAVENYLTAKSAKSARLLSLSKQRYILTLHPLRLIFPMQKFRLR